MNKKFISAIKEYCTLQKYLAAPYLRKSFELDFIPDNAVIAISGLGFYRIYKRKRHYKGCFGSIH